MKEKIQIIQVVERKKMCSINTHKKGYFELYFKTARLHILLKVLFINLHVSECNLIIIC